MSPGRSVRLVLTGADGDPLGALPDLAVPLPFWPETASVTAAAGAAHDVRVTVLRLLGSSASPTTMGGAVTYLAEIGPGQRRPALLPLTDDEIVAATTEHPLRMPWARPGGVTALLAWADDALESLGRPRTGPAEQVKTWNLSMIARLPTSSGPVWLKAVPPFFCHEGAVLARLGADHPDLVPAALAVAPGGGVALIDHVDGTEQWDAPPHRVLEMVDRQVELQVEWAGRVDELLAGPTAGLGLPDRRSGPLTEAVTALTRRVDVRAGLGADLLDRIDALVADLPRLVEVLDGDGLPTTLVHGDLHTGNWLHGPRGLRLIDWGDSAVGHPLLDQSAFVSSLPDAERDAVRAHWARRWRQAVPGSDPVAGSVAVQPLAALQRALVYRGFVDRIEPSERRYHELDVPDWLERAVDAPR